VSIPCPVAILVGGRATRLGAIASDRPKALVEVAGKPFLFHQLAMLRDQGVAEVVLCIGRFGEAIRDVVGDGSDHGLAVAYSEDPPGRSGTATAVRNALSLLGNEFMVLYGDTYLRIDFADVHRAFRRSERLALLTVLRNRGRWDRSNTELHGDIVVRHDKRNPTPAMEWIDYGLAALRVGAFARREAAEDLSDVYGRLAADGQLAAYPVSARFYEIGTPQALAETSRFLASRTG
jgi:N-acetyl-alpha-D-muramate 1-phosphate uridylyltransferase